MANGPFLFVALVGAYLLGSLPFGVLVGRLWAGVDIRDHGSGNIGFTNMLRVLGPLPGLLVLIGDVAKGAAGAYLGRTLTGSDLAALLAAVASVAGHNWSIFLRFRGGRGVNTTAGAFGYLAPQPILAAFTVWALVVILTRYVSLASIIAALTAPIFMWVFGYPYPYVAFMLLAAVFIVFRHRANIKRLLQGTESKIGQRVKIK